MGSQPLFEIEKRLLARQGAWLVKTREIPELGPYRSQLEAIEALYRHVTICSGVLRKEKPELARQFVQHSITECKKPDCELCAALLALAPDTPVVQLKA
ncbi:MULTISPECIES: hypothetical protein [Marinobacter]|nr:MULTISPECIES: hypothetical protein [Marinobacter]MCK2148267.1 hypothetical protein [Marinobacter alexandrii]